MPKPSRRKKHRKPKKRRKEKKAAPHEPKPESSADAPDIAGLLAIESMILQQMAGQATRDNLAQSIDRAMAENMSALRQNTFY